MSFQRMLLTNSQRIRKLNRRMWRLRGWLSGDRWLKSRVSGWGK